MKKSRAIRSQQWRILQQQTLRRYNKRHQRQCAGRDCRYELQKSRRLVDPPRPPSGTARHFPLCLAIFLPPTGRSVAHLPVDRIFSLFAIGPAEPWQSPVLDPIDRIPFYVPAYAGWTRPHPTSYRYPKYGRDDSVRSYLRLRSTTSRT